jgi:hypothetical protein
VNLSETGFLTGGHESMTVYVVFRKDYVYKRGQLRGVLVERRRDSRGMPVLESGLKWAREAFGHLVNDKKDIYVFPKELNISEDQMLLVEKGIFTKEEFEEVMKKIGQEMKVGDY